MSLGLSVSWALVGLANAITVYAPPGRVGVVMEVDREKGEITLVYRGGIRTCLTAHPILLKDVRIGGPVHVITDGTVVQSLRCL